MGYLMNVKERQAATDDMFEPLRQTIELLKSYDQELPEEVNVLLQVSDLILNTNKKIALLQLTKIIFIYGSILTSIIHHQNIALSCRSCFLFTNF